MFAGVFGGYGWNGSGSCAAPGGPCVTVIQQAVVNLPSLATYTMLGTAGRLALTYIALAVLIGLAAWIGEPILALNRGASSRTAILILSILTTALLIARVVFSLRGAGQVLSAPQVCIGGPGVPIYSGAPYCYSGAHAYWLGVLGVTWPSIVASLLLSTPVWVMTLTQTARLKQWGWFVMVFLFSPIAALLYAFFGASRPATPAGAALTNSAIAPAPSV
jgi:hypothetical protein